MKLSEYRLWLATTTNDQRDKNTGKHEFRREIFESCSNRIAENCNKYLKNELEREELVHQIQAELCSYLYSSPMGTDKNDWQVAICSFVEVQSYEGTTRHQNVLAILATSTWGAAHYFSYPKFVSTANVLGAALAKLRELTKMALPVFWDSFAGLSVESSWSTNSAAELMGVHKERFVGFLAMLYSAHLPFVRFEDLANYFSDRAERMSFHRAFASHSFGLAKIYDSLGLTQISDRLAGMISHFEPWSTNLLRSTFDRELFNMRMYFQGELGLDQLHGLFVGFDEQFDGMNSDRSLVAYSATSIFMADMIGEYGISQSAGWFGAAEMGMIDLSPTKTISEISMAPYADIAWSDVGRGVGPLLIGAGAVLARAHPVTGIIAAGVGVYTTYKSNEEFVDQTWNDFKKFTGELAKELSDAAIEPADGAEEAPIKPVSESAVPVPSAEKSKNDKEKEEDKEETGAPVDSSVAVPGPNVRTPGIVCVTPYVEEDFNWVSSEELKVILGRVDDYFWSSRTPTHPDLTDNSDGEISPAMKKMVSLWLQHKMIPQLVNFLPDDEDNQLKSTEIVQLLRISAAFYGVNPGLITYVPGSIPIDMPKIPKKKAPRKGDNVDPKHDPKGGDEPIGDNPLGEPEEDPLTDDVPLLGKAVSESLSEIVETQIKRNKFNPSNLQALGQQAHLKLMSNSDKLQITINPPQYRKAQ